MVAIDPTSGAVRVLVGGRDYYESNFNRATQVHRIFVFIFICNHQFLLLYPNIYVYCNDSCLITRN